jgi:hypothetical protein
LIAPIPAKAIDPVTYVISANIRRRHLTCEQKRTLIAELLRADPNRSNLWTAKLVGVDDKTVGSVRRDLEARSEIPNVAKTTDTKGRQQPVHKPKTVSVKPPPPPTPAQRVEEKIRQAAIADKKKHGDLSLARIMDEVVTAAERDELVTLANHSAPERHVPARQWCESHNIDWKPASSAEQTAEERKALYADEESETPKPIINGARALMASRQEPDDSLDFFPTPLWATRALFEQVLPVLGITDLRLMTVWEPACGERHMSAVLREYFDNVVESDVHDYCDQTYEVLDFLASEDHGITADWIVTNPPFSGRRENNRALRFTCRALELARTGVAMFVRAQFLETTSRYELLFRDNPPTLIAYFAERVPLHKGRWEPDGDTATQYCWLIWLKDRERVPPFWIPPGQEKWLSKPEDRERFAAWSLPVRDPEILEDAAEG